MTREDWIELYQLCKEFLTSGALNGNRNGNNTFSGFWDRNRSGIRHGNKDNKSNESRNNIGMARADWIELYQLCKVFLTSGALNRNGNNTISRSWNGHRNGISQGNKYNNNNDSRNTIGMASVWKSNYTSQKIVKTEPNRTRTQPDFRLRLHHFGLISVASYG